MDFLLKNVYFLNKLAPPVFQRLPTKKHWFNHQNLPIYWCFSIISCRYTFEGSVEYYGEFVHKENGGYNGNNEVL